MRVVAYLTRLSNIVVDNGDPFPFDTARVMDTDYATWSETPGDPIVIVQSRWYYVGGDFTSLASFYGGPAAADWIVQLTRNGLDLDHTIVAEWVYEPTTGATGRGLGSPVYLEAGDEIQATVINSSASTILIESNPSDGVPDGYLADAGPGTLSPHLYLIALSGPAPG